MLIRPTKIRQNHDPTRSDPIRPDPPKSGKIMTRSDPTHESIRPVDNSDILYTTWRLFAHEIFHETEERFIKNLGTNRMKSRTGNARSGNYINAPILRFWRKKCSRNRSLDLHVQGLIVKVTDKVSGWCFYRLKTSQLSCLPVLKLCMPSTCIDQLLVWVTFMFFSLTVHHRLMFSLNDDRWAACLGSPLVIEAP